MTTSGQHWRNDSWGYLDQTTASEVTKRSYLIHGQASLTDFINARKALLEAVQVREGSILIEIGCGPAPYRAVTAARLGTTGRWIGIDATSAFIVEAQELCAQDHIANAEFRVGQAQDIPLEDASADGVIADKVLIHVAPIQRVVEEMVRVARPGGWVGACDAYSDGVFAHSSDLGLTRKILRYSADQRATPQAAAETAEAFAVAGLEYVQRQGILALMSDPNQSFVPGLINHWVRRAVEAGVINQDEAVWWYRDVLDKAQRSSLLIAFPMIITWGRKPT